MSFSNEIKTLIYCQIFDEYETEKAYCFSFMEGGVLMERVYLPKSQVEDIRETVNEVDIPLWLVEKKELEDFIK